VSEGLALNWEDFDSKVETVTIQRAFTHSELKEAKAEASMSTMPVAGFLLEQLKPEYKIAGDPRWATGSLDFHSRQ